MTTGEPTDTSTIKEDIPFERLFNELGKDDLLDPKDPQLEILRQCEVYKGNFGLIQGIYDTDENGIYAEYQVKKNISKTHSKEFEYQIMAPYSSGIVKPPELLTLCTTKVTGHEIPPTQQFFIYKSYLFRKDGTQSIFTQVHTYIPIGARYISLLQTNGRINYGIVEKKSYTSIIDNHIII